MVHYRVFKENVTVKCHSCRSEIGRHRIRTPMTDLYLCEKCMTILKGLVSEAHEEDEG